MPKAVVGIALVCALAISLSTVSPARAQTPGAGPTPQAADDADQSPRARARRAREQARDAAKQTRDAQKVMAAFSGAAGTYTDIVELTLAERMDTVRLRIAAARGDLARLRPMVADETFGRLENRLTDVEAAYDKGDRTATALAALEGFKTILDSADPRLRRSPVEISLQSYNAFKIMVLTSAPAVDWPAVRLLAKDSEKTWISIRRFVRDTNLRVLLSRIQGGLREAAGRDDAASVKFAASLQLASVPVLQDFYARMTEAMARGRKGDMSQLQSMMGR